MAEDPNPVYMLLNQQRETLAEQNRMLVDQGKQNERIEQSLKDLNTRLYNGGSGAIPELFRLNAARCVDHETLKTNIVTYRQQDNQKHGLTGAMSAVAALLVKLALGKLGWHF